VEFLVRQLQDEVKVATLSRGYGRKTTGFGQVLPTSPAAEVGDEPLQLFTHFKGEIPVFVGEDRVGAAQKIHELLPNLQLLVLDDAFQHRKVKAGFYILLTAYDDLFSDDFILPFGNLRESSIGKKRANLVVVTKCPQNITEKNKNEVKLKLNVNVPVFFASIDYDSNVYGTENSISVSDIISKEKVILAGIAKPKYFIDYLNSGNDKVMIFPDHHNFSETEISEIKKASKDKILITTEKDFMRLQGKIPTNNLYYLPIQSKFVSDKEKFDALVANWVKNYTM
jgi:tetraacyldisaccharide 4'-kinase